MKPSSNIFVPAHVQLHEPRKVAGMSFLPYSGTWNPYPYKTPKLVTLALVLSVVSTVVSIANVVVCLLK